METVARSAVNVWLAGCDAYRRLVARDPASLDAGVARERLDAVYHQLLDLMQRAHTQLAGHASRNPIDDLRMQLVAAAAALGSDVAPPGRNTGGR